MFNKKEVKMAKNKIKKPSQGIAIAGLLLNILILPGLGSLIGGKISSGVLQLIFSLIGLGLTLTIIGAIIGIPLMIAMWIWALVTGIKLISEAK